MTQTTLGLAAPVFYGRVQPELLKMADPAPGDGFTIEIGTVYYERPIALAFLCTPGTDQNAVLVTLSLLDPTGAPVAVITPSAATVGSAPAQFSYLTNVSVASDIGGASFLAPLFDFIIPSTYSLVVSGDDFDSDGQISAIRYYRDRFSTDPKDYEQGGLDFDPVFNQLREDSAIVG